MLVEIQVCIFPASTDLALANHFEFFPLDESQNCMRADGRGSPFLVNMRRVLKNLMTMFTKPKNTVLAEVPSFFVGIFDVLWIF